MSDKKPAVDWKIYLIGGVTLIWNILGILNFVGQLNPETVAAMPESHRALIEGRPIWATLAFGLAVTTGAIGCLLILLRKRAAVLMLIVSLVCVAVQLIPSLYLISNGLSFSFLEIALAFIMPFIVSLYLVRFASFLNRQGWLN
ncbi:MAG: hypothetical protein AAGA53_06050 [Pseudomonadota bacterium]